MAGRRRVSTVLLALVAGLIAGWFAGPDASGWGHRLLAWIAPLGTLWINAVRMTVVPLVVSLVFTSLVSWGDGNAPSANTPSREATRIVVAFVAMLALAVAVACLVAPPVIHDLRVSAETSAALRGTAVSTAAATREQFARLPSFAAWLTALAPSNVVKAAADAAMLPLILFTALFAFAARGMAPERRAPIVAVFDAVGAAMLVIVDWTIRLAPIGVFASVALPAATSGASIAGAVGYYVIAMAVTLTLYAALLYPVVQVAGVPVRAFARGVFPAQAMAFASSSSLASLPALLGGASDVGVPPRTAGLVLPLAVGTLKAAAPISWTVGALFVATLYGVPMSTTGVLTVALSAAAASFSIPGVPGGSLLLLSGVLAGIGVPVEGVALLIAADTIPDLFGTAANVTADMAAAALVGGGRRADSVVDPDEAVE